MSYLSATDALEYLCYELPPLRTHDGLESHDEESSGLLSGTNTRRSCTNDNECVSMASFAGLSTLEIAILADAKKFLAHRPVSFAINLIGSHFDGLMQVQRMVNGMYVFRFNYSINE